MSSPVVEVEDKLVEDQLDVEQEESPEPSRIAKMVWMAIKALVLIGLVAYTIVAFTIDFKRARPLLYIWIFIVGILLIKVVNKFGSKQTNAAFGAFNSAIEKVVESRVLSIIVALVTIAIIGVIIGLSIDSADRLISLAGIFVLLGLTWLTSWKPRDVKWRPVIGGLLFQFVFGFLILRTNAGFNLFQFFGDQVTVLLDYAKAGSGFVFGWTNSWQGFTQTYDSEELTAPFKVLEIGPVFAANVLPTVIFFSALVSVLYYFGILQVIIRVIGRALAYLLGTSASESLNAAGNIFVGQTEAPLLIRPFLADMTESEIHATMTGGFATIAGGVLAFYISFGISASHLLAASVMSAPAALAVSKLAYPETEISKTRAGVEYEIEVPDQINFIEAAASGATTAIELALNIGGQLIAFIALIAMLNAWLGYFGTFIDVPDLSFEKICGWVFFPFAFLMGVDIDDCESIASVLGTKIFVNEFVAYDILSDLIKAQAISKRSEIIATYALCGFANFGSIGIQIGGLTPLAPHRSKSIAKLVFSAMIAGNTACFLTACIAGLLYDIDRA